LKGLSELCQDVCSDGEATKVNEKDKSVQQVSKKLKHIYKQLCLISKLTLFQSFSKTVLDIFSTIKDVLCLLVFLYKTAVTDKDWKQTLEDFQVNAQFH